MKSLSTLGFCLFIYVNVSAQYAMNLTPRISSDNSISERIAYTNISIEYGSPKVRGRMIWGDMEEYGQIWRAGANKATKISFSEDVVVQGKSLLKGEYALFIIPSLDSEWTVIFNKKAEQWGAFGYDEGEDALRVKVNAEMNEHVEDLTYDIVANSFDGAYVSLEWEKIKLRFYVGVEHLQVLEKKLSERLELAPENTEWVVYLQAANYLIDEGERLDLAEDWLDKSTDLFPNTGEWSGQYYPKVYIQGDLLWAKAKLAALQEDYAKALQFADEMKNLAGNYVFYEIEKDSEQIDRRMKTWSEEK